MAAKKKTKAKTAKKAEPRTRKKAVAKTAKKAAAKRTPGKKAQARKRSAKAAEKTDAMTEGQAAAAPAAKAAAKSPGPEAEARRLKVTLTKSVHGRLASHRACAIGLGLRRRHQTVEIEDTPCTRGMINRIRYMLDVEGQ
ncbi:MAG TPA: 50S ribosomal protein L30 [Gammaproteobacteria bacterium]|nr:50S ribosomal protein L30 [Gammaproteobacteria bacterium]